MYCNSGVVDRGCLCVSRDRVHQRSISQVTGRRPHKHWCIMFLATGHTEECNWTHEGAASIELSHENVLYPTLFNRPLPIYGRYVDQPMPLSNLAGTGLLAWVDKPAIVSCYKWCLIYQCLKRLLLKVARNTFCLSDIQFPVNDS